MDIFLTNNLTNKKELFIPRNKKNVGMYVCGPTVYDDPHIGNARPIVTFDILFKLLKTEFQNVTYVSFFPYNNPKNLNLTFMQNPKESYGKYMTAGNTVKPSFYNILKEIYIYLDLSIINTKSTDI